MTEEDQSNTQHSDAEILRTWQEGITFNDPAEVDRERFPLWPHGSDVDSYSKLFRERGKCESILILGATPALRDLAAEYGKKVIVADANSLMLITTSKLLTRADPNKEQWLHANWLELALEKNSVDIIAGDLVWWLFSAQQQNVFREAIAGLLRRSGVFISRFFVRPAQRAAPLEILKSYIEEAVRMPQKRAELYHVAFLHVTSALWEVGQETMERKRVADAVVSLQGNFPKEIWEQFEPKVVSWRQGMPLTLQTREQIENILEQQFTLKRYCAVDDYQGAEMFPVISWEVKKHRAS